VAIIITSDKCYENVEWEWGYKETDAVGGRDIYSASKGAAEVIFHAYHWSFFKDERKHIRLVSARAGNVIGGGDWAKDRIVVDCMKRWSVGEPVEIRSPLATRPWQHVLEPLSGYLELGACLNSDYKLHGESFNFGPRYEKSKTVCELINDLSQYWGFDESWESFQVIENIPFHESGLLKLNCDKALFHLNWEGTLFYEECVKLVSEWYRDYYSHNQDMFALTMAQLSYYESLAAERGLKWTKE
jgi:CDP-glucose 4,6-dehydratase